MIKRPSKAKGARRTDWAAKVRKFKPQLNALTDEERTRLLHEGLTFLELLSS